MCTKNCIRGLLVQADSCKELGCHGSYPDLKNKLNKLKPRIFLTLQRTGVTRKKYYGKIWRGRQFQESGQELISEAGASRAINWQKHRQF